MPKRPQTTAVERALERALEEASGWITSNVRAYRQRAGLTQQELAEAVGVATTYIARIESADETVNPSLRLLVALARALDCRPHELLVPTAPPKRLAPGRPAAPGAPTSARRRRS